MTIQDKAIESVGNYWSDVLRTVGADAQNRVKFREMKALVSGRVPNPILDYFPDHVHRYALAHTPGIVARRGKNGGYWIQ